MAGQARAGTPCRARTTLQHPASAPRLRACGPSGDPPPSQHPEICLWQRPFQTEEGSRELGGSGRPVSSWGRDWPPSELEREAARRGCSSSRWSGACASLGVFRRHETCTVAQVYGGRVLGEAEDAEHLLQIPPKTSKGAQREKSWSTFRPADARADCCASAPFIPRLPCGAPPAAPSCLPLSLIHFA